LRSHLRIGLGVRAEEERARKPPITVKFEIPYFTLSGLQVRVLSRGGLTVVLHNFVGSIFEGSRREDELPSTTVGTIFDEVCPTTAPFPVSTPLPDLAITSCANRLERAMVPLALRRRGRLQLLHRDDEVLASLFRWWTGASMWLFLDLWCSLSLGISGTHPSMFVAITQGHHTISR